MSKKEGSLSLIRKLGYGIGDMGSNFCWSFVAAFIMIYCTNTLGVSAAIIGTLMMISKILDGVTDVFMGNIIDRTNHKMGKARFWYFVSCFPVAVFTFIIFNVPKNLSDTEKYVFFFIIYTLLGAVFYTMNNIAYSSMTALCTKDPKDRVQMGSFRFLFAIIAVLIIQTITSGMVESLGGGQAAWTQVSIIYSIVCFVLLLVPVFSVKELSPEELGEQENVNKTANEKIGFVESIKLLMKNKYFVLILCIYLVNYIVSGLTSGLGIYYATYKLGNAALLGVISMASLIPIIIALPLVAPFTAKYGIRKMSILGNILGLVATIPLVIAAVSGNLPLLLVALALKTIGGAPLTGALNALIAETDDYSYLKFGKRITGTIYSCSSVGVKVGTGLGTALTGFLLDFGGFDGQAAEQTARAISVINWSYVLAYAIPGVILLTILFFLDVESENKRLRADKEV